VQFHKVEKKLISLKRTIHKTPRSEGQPITVPKHDAMEGGGGGMQLNLLVTRRNQFHDTVAFTHRKIQVKQVHSVLEAGIVQSV
jgi:hypothetical protein